MAATSGITEDDLEALEKELEDLMVDDNNAGMFRSIVTYELVLM